MRGISVVREVNMLTDHNFTWDSVSCVPVKHRKSLTPMDNHLNE